MRTLLVTKEAGAGIEPANRFTHCEAIYVPVATKTSHNIIDIGECCDFVVTHAKPQKRLPRMLAVLDLLLHQRNRSTAPEINEDHNQAVQGRKAQGRLA